jgi:deoxycytidylate deaminase
MNLNPNDIKYPYLPDGREILGAAGQNTYLQTAKEMADNHSTDILHPTGSVVVKDGEIIGRAANISRLKNKKLFELHMNGLCLRRKLKIPSGKHYWICPGCAPCKNHSEQRAVRDAQDKGFDTRGADLYLYGHWWCCRECWDKMIEAGIKNVYVHEDSKKLFRRESSENILGNKK